MSGAAAASPLLSVRDLAVVFPPRRGHPAVHAVKDVSFDILPGETLGLVGESGSGKTTTGRAVLQLQTPSAGTVTLRGRAITGMGSRELRAMRRHMQFVLQNPYSSLHPRMTIGAILTEPLRVHRTVPPGEYGARVAALLEMVGLDPAMQRRYPHEFSGGQRQRIAIARALAVDPDFVVCDEPVSALDVRTQARVVELLRDLKEKLGLTVLFIAHDLAIVRQVADRVAVMYGGRIVEIGPSGDVLGTPGHPYTRALLAAVPVPIPALQRERLAAGPDGAAPPAAGTDACPFGERHSETGAPHWHEIAPGHAVLCDGWERAGGR